MQISLREKSCAAAEFRLLDVWDRFEFNFSKAVFPRFNYTTPLSTSPLCNQRAQRTEGTVSDLEVNKRLEAGTGNMELAIIPTNFFIL